MSIKNAKVRNYNQLFEFLSAPTFPGHEQPALVFGRQDPLLAEAMHRLDGECVARYFIVSGRIGKDSGNLEELGLTEARFIAEGLPKDGIRGATQLGVSADKIILDEKAQNGGENARNAIAIMQEPSFVALSGLEIVTSVRSGDNVTAVAHAISLRRLAETLRHEAMTAKLNIGEINMVPTTLNFDVHNPIQRAEALAEAMRLIDWPAKGWLQPVEIPEKLMEFARHESAKAS